MSHRRLQRTPAPVGILVKMPDLPDLIRVVAEQTGQSPANLRRIYKEFFELIAEALARGETISLRHLGRFKVHEYPSKSLPDPRKRGRHLIVLPTKVLKFRPSPYLRHAVEERKGSLTKEVAPRRAPLPVPPSVPTPATALEPEPTQEAAATPEAATPEHEHEIEISFGEKPAAAVPRLKKPVIMTGDVKITQEVHRGSPPEQTEEKKAPSEPSTPGLKAWWSRLTTHDEPEATPVPAADIDAKAAPNSENEEEVARGAVTTLATSTNTVKATPKPEKTETARPATEEAANSSLKARTSVSYRSLANLRVDKEVLNLLPELFARRHKVVPIERKDKQLTVAMVNPDDLEVIQLIQKTTGLDIQPVLSSSEDIAAILNQYSALEAEVANVIKDSDLEMDKEALAEADETGIEEMGDDSPTARIVFSLLRRAVREKASDVHIEPQDNFLQVRFRMDGVLRQRLKLPLPIQQAVIARLKILANLKIDEHRLPQDGRFQLDIDKNLVDFRLSIMPVADGEKAVMRVLDKTQGLLTLEEIGVRGGALDVVKSNVKKSYGMTLITGPTGSGKTTSLYALLGQLMDIGVNIITLENPIEYRVSGVNQSQVNPDIGYDFADGLRAIVRQDPDIIMVGEIRDKPTAEIAIQSALTGHIVLSTLHTNNSSGAFPRLIDMGVEPFLISSSINTVIAQRLARKICDHCRTAYEPSAAELAVVKEELAKIPEKYRPAKVKKYHFSKGKGCEVCNHTGYKGRVGLFEVLGVTEQVQQAVINRATDTQIEKLAVSQGTILMLQDGLLKALDGITSLEEVWRVTRD